MFRIPHGGLDLHGLVTPISLASHLELMKMWIEKRWEETGLGPAVGSGARPAAKTGEA